MSFFQKNKLSSIVCGGGKISVNGYSGFFPNELINLCTDTELLVYSSIQFLSFYNIPVTIDEILTRTGIKRKTIKNNILSLKNKSILFIRNKVAYFISLKSSDFSIEVTAKEIAALHKGYVVPLDLMKSKSLSVCEKKVLVIMLSVIFTNGVKRIDMEWVGNKIGRERRTVGKAVSSLVRKNYLSRIKLPKLNGYIYKVGSNITREGKDVMSLNNVQSPGNVTLESPGNVTLSIIDNSVNNNKDLSKDYNELLDKVHENKNLNNFKKNVDILEATAVSIDCDISKKERDLNDLNKQFCDSLLNKDLNRLSELRTRLSSKEISVNTAKYRLGYILGVTSDFEFVMRNEVKVSIGSPMYQFFGKVAKKILPRFENKDIQKSVCCLLLSSMIYDYQDEYFKSKKVNWNKGADFIKNIAVKAVLSRVSGDYNIHWKIFSRHGLDKVLVKKQEKSEGWVL